MKLRPDSRAMLLLMATFVALGPLSTDMYLPALPAMVDFFGTTLASVQLTISAYLIGFAAFHLLCGPLADRFGRKPVLLGGTLLFCLSCIGCALADSIEVLIVFRFIQGLGACTGPTLARAMVRDIYGPQRAAGALALMAAIMALAPVFAPVLGGWMLTWLSWPAIFWFLSFYGVVGIVALLLLLPETLPERQSLNLGHVMGNYRQLLSHPHFLVSVLGIAALYSGAFAFISGSSFVLIDFMGVSPQHFGWWFMVIVTGYIGGSVFTARFSHRWDGLSVMFAGAALGVVAALAMVALVVLEVHHPLAVILPMAFYTAAVGITMPQAMSLALAPFPRMAATASALLGFLQMAVASLVGVVVGLLLVESALPMALSILVVGVIALCSFAALSRMPTLCYD